MKLENTADVGILIAVLLLLGFAVAWPALGPWEAVRGFAVEMVALGAMFFLARQYLPWEDAPRERITAPKWELIIGAVGFLVFFVAWPLLLRSPDLVELATNIMFANAALLAFTASILALYRYSRRSWGLRWPTGRELLVLAAVAAVGIGLSLIFGSLLPGSESAMSQPARPLMPGALLWSFINDLSSGNFVVVLVLGVFLLSVIGQELFFRVYLQARLAHFLPGRWALFAQAALFFAATLLPFYLWFADPPPATLFLTQAAVLSNGVLAGYFWRKTGSLPLLVLLHLLAFVRWGL